MSLHCGSLRVPDSESFTPLLTMSYRQGDHAKQPADDHYNKLTCHIGFASYTTLACVSVLAGYIIVASYINTPVLLVSINAEFSYMPVSVHSLLGYSCKVGHPCQVVEFLPLYTHHKDAHAR
eukprot:scaffold143351_cov22-Tisochrysis_lutea.AAC.1